MITPCKNCTDRNPECHSNCERYDEWKAYMDGVNEIKNKECSLRASFRERSYDKYMKAQKRSFPRKRGEY